MPEMKSDGGALAFRLPVELFIVQVVSQIKDNLVNILETVECVIERGSGHMVPLIRPDMSYQLHCSRYPAHGQ